MKRDDYTELICKEFCKYYKQGREALACGTYNFLARNLTQLEIESLIHYVEKSPDFSSDEDIRQLICRRCDFLEDGCDFREGIDAPPCGGYTVIAWLLKNKAGYI